MYNRPVTLRLRSGLPFFLTLLITGSIATQQTITFDESMDAVSVRLPHDDAVVMMRKEDGWHRFVIEKEFDPLLMESDLVMLPEGTDRIVLKGQLDGIRVHPIVVSKEPSSYKLAATQFYRAPRILSRADWGADDSFLFIGPKVERSDEPVAASTSSTGTSSSKRVDDCTLAQRQSPGDFRTTKTITHNADGMAYRWPLRYSPKVKAIVLHHTAQKVSGDNRPAVERMRALFEYHANSRGWGDIGYHYIIDEVGTIYEGRTGGENVVGGHVYCANVGTIGIVLMGNFEVEQPTQSQVQSAQWLMRDLADKYGIDLRKSVSFKGKKTNPIVRHKDLISTECPGKYLSPAITQIRGNVIAGNVNNTVDFPRMVADTRAARKKRTVSLQEAGKQLSRRFYRTKRQIRTATRQDSSRLKFYNNQLATTSDIQRKRSPRVQKPMRPTGTLYRPYNQQPTTNNLSNPNHIRIRLGYTGNTAAIEVDGNTIRLGKDGNSCVAANYQLPTPNPRISAKDGYLTITSWNTKWNRFRGVIECRVINGELVLINELPLEQYLMGLSEQPDTEPREKQKAFAIAARSYAAFYMVPGQEKFAGMPYHGSDTGKSFQSYSGVAYEEDNPKWVQSVMDTKDRVLMKDGDIIKAAYYSSNDGRTRSPEQNGWRNFPHAEVFASKPDPWCKGLTLRGHGVGMSGCGAEGQSLQGKKAEEILKYYYPGTVATRRPVQ